MHHTELLMGVLSCVGCGHYAPATPYTEQRYGAHAGAAVDPSGITRRALVPKPLTQEEEAGPRKDYCFRVMGCHIIGCRIIGCRVIGMPLYAAS